MPKRKTVKAKKSPRRRKSAARRKARPTQDVSASGMLKAFMQGKFKEVSRGLEQRAHRQIAELRVAADRKSTELHRQVEDVRKEVGRAVRKQTEQDLKTVEKRLREVTTRLRQVEKRIFGS